MAEGVLYMYILISNFIHSGEIMHEGFDEHILVSSKILKQGFRSANIIKSIAC